MSHARFAAPIVLALVTLALLMGAGAVTNEVAGSASPSAASVAAIDTNDDGRLDA
jgi:Trk K+ transport system NAD-binding subunit